MTKKKAGSTVQKATETPAGHTAAGVNFENPPAGTNPRDAGTPGAPGALPVEPFAVVGLGIFGAREVARLESIALEIESLQTRSAALLARIPGEVYRLLETCGEATGGTVSPDLTAAILADVATMPGETAADRVKGYAVKERARIKMRAAQAEFESMRGLAGVSDPVGDLVKLISDPHAHAAGSQPGETIDTPQPGAGEGIGDGEPVE